MTSLNYDSGSFRDPSGRVFSLGGKIFRELDDADYQAFLEFQKTAVYEGLINDKMIVNSKPINKEALGIDTERNVIEHEKISFISYPYEWPGEMLRDAGLHILKLQIRLLESGYTLKDATPYNIQFKDGKLIWIDIPSIEKWDKKVSWFAYNQFARFFLYPLLLNKYRNIDLRQMLLPELDGMSFEQTISMLPFWIKYRPKFFVDIGLPNLLGKMIKEETSHKIIQNQKENPHAKELQKNNLLRLKKLVQGLNKKSKSFWSAYESIKNYNDKSVEEKNNFVNNSLKEAGAKRVVDIGCNTGVYSIIATNALPNAEIISTDFDAQSVERLYIRNKKELKKNILPLVLDITNPSPALGWMSKERKSFLDRADFDAVLALAVIHHLRVHKNIPLEQIAKLFSEITKQHLIIEYVAKEDSMFQRLTAIRKDTFGDYTLENFEKLFGQYFNLKKKIQLEMGTRHLYLYEKKA